MIAAGLHRKPRPPFRYFDKGDMATIGRNSAIAKVEWPFKAHLSGFFAWMTWALVHIFFLIGFRNRLRVMASWFWTYIFFSRGARLITGDPRLPGWRDQVAAGESEGVAEEAEKAASSL
jgi:NADH dehydrogenase